MRRIFLMLLIAMPGMAQVERDTLFDLLDKGKTSVALDLIRKDCFDFRVEASDLERLQEHRDVILAMIGCLQDQLGTIAAANTLVASADADVVERKVAESINTLIIADQLRDTDNKIRTRMDAGQLLITLLTEQGGSVERENVLSSLPEGYEPPEWFDDALARGAAAHRDGFPTVTLTARRGTDFAASQTEKEINVFMSLYLVDRAPDEAKPYTYAEDLVFTHPQFPITYDPQNDRFSMQPIENTDITRLRLNRALERFDTLELFPGWWVLEIRSRGAENRIKSHDEFNFQIEPGKDYNLQMRWQTKRGVKTMDFTLEEKGEGS